MVVTPSKIPRLGVKHVLLLVTPAGYVNRIQIRVRKDIYPNQSSAGVVHTRHDFDRKRALLKEASLVKSASMC